MKKNKLNINKHQVEIIQRHSKGETEKAIAHNMGISTSTVKYHKQKLFRNLNINSIPEAIYKLKDRNLI